MFAPSEEPTDAPPTCNAIVYDVTQKFDMYGLRRLFFITRQATRPPQRGEKRGDASARSKGGGTIAAAQALSAMCELQEQRGRSGQPMVGARIRRVRRRRLCTRAAFQKARTACAPPVRAFGRSLARTIRGIGPCPTRTRSGLFSCRPRLPVAPSDNPRKLKIGPNPVPNPVPRLVPNPVPRSVPRSITLTLSGMIALAAPCVSAAEL